MQRYFIPIDSWQDNKVIITGDDVHHISKVMRFTTGDEIICNNKNGRAAQCKISKVDKEFVEATILTWLDEKKELPVEVTIVHGIPKADKFELVLQKGTELGARKFIPFQSERSIAVWDNKKWEKKVHRFKKIIKEASEQSHRTIIPSLSKPKSLSEIMKESKDYDVKLFAYEEEAKVENENSLGSVLNQIKKEQKIFICIGPEGGFSEYEANILKENEFHAVRLGPRILRTETAPLYALAAISYHFEELSINVSASDA